MGTECLGVIPAIGADGPSPHGARGCPGTRARGKLTACLPAEYTRPALAAGWESRQGGLVSGAGGLGGPNGSSAASGTPPERGPVLCFYWRFHRPDDAW